MRPAFLVTTLSTLIAVAGCSDDAATVIDAALVDAALIDTPNDCCLPGPDAAVDAPVDAPAPSTVVEVPCAGANPVVTVTAPGFAFSPMAATISVGQVVQFQMPASHSAVSGSPAGTSDGQFTVGFSQQKCLRFTSAGVFPYWCNPHQFTATITVTPPA